MEENLSVNINSGGIKRETDIVYEKENGRWNQKISSYEKIKIPQGTIKHYIKGTGFDIEFFEVRNGLITLIAKKPA